MGLERVDDLTLHFAPDGQTIAISAYQGACCGGGMRSLSLWDVVAGTLIKNEPGRNFYFSPDGKTVGFGSQILNTSDGSVHATIDGFMSLGHYLAFIDDGRKLVSFDGQKDHPFFIYQVDIDQSKWVQLSDLGSIGFSINQAGKFSAFSPYLFGYWKQDELFNELGPKVQGQGYYDLAGQILFSPDNQTLATGSRYDGILRLWNIQEQRLLFEQSTCPSKMTSSLAFSPNGKQIASACTDPVFERNGERNIQVWQIAPAPQHLMELSGYGYTIVTYSPDGKYIAGAGNHVQVWSAIDGKSIFGVDDNSFQNLYGLEAQSIAFSPNSDILAFGLKDGSVELWSVMEGKRLNVLLTTEFNPLYSQNGYNPVHALAFSPDGKLIAIGLEDGSVRLWGLK
jgi:WD40 repeat protein